MAYRRRTFRRRTGRKRPIRRSRVPRLPRMSNRNTSVYHYKFRYQNLVGTGASGSASAAMMLNYPFFLYNGTTYSSPQVPYPYARCVTLYQEYRVKGIHVRWVPRMTQLEYKAAEASGLDTNMYITCDYQTPSPPTAAIQAMNDPSMRLVNWTKPFKQYFKNNSNRGWFRCGAAPTDTQATDTVVPVNPLGAIKYLLLTGSATDPMVAGSWVVTYYVKFRIISSDQTDPGAQALNQQESKI